MAITDMSGKVYVYLNGKRQTLVESLTYNITQRTEEVQVLDSKWPLPRKIITEGDGEVTFLLGDMDDDYGAVEWLGRLIGYPGWDDTNDQWDVTDQDMTIDTAGNLKQYFYDRYSVGSGTVVIDDGSPLTVAYVQRGDEIERVALHFLSAGKVGTGPMEITINPGGDVGYIQDGGAAGISANLDTEKEYLIYGVADKAAVGGTAITLTTTATATMAFEMDTAADDQDLAANVANTLPWMQLRQYTSNLMDLVVRVYEDTNTNYVIHTFDRVRFTKGGVDLDNDSAAKGRVSFTFQDYTLTQG